MKNKNEPILFDSCFVDHSFRQFACMNDHCSDFKGCFKNDGGYGNVDFQMLHFHPEDRKLWCDKVFPALISFVNSQSGVEIQDYRFSFNHRYLRSDGSLSQFLHEGTLSYTNEKCLPVLNLNVFFELGDIKPDETIVLSISRYRPPYGYQKVFNQVYSYPHPSILSQRELEIVRLCHEGFSSKMIAEKLTLSIHTVKNHKRNSMEKTLTHNISELIHLCIQNYWL